MVYSLGKVRWRVIGSAWQESVDRCINLQGHCSCINFDHVGIHGRNHSPPRTCPEPLNRPLTGEVDRPTGPVAGRLSPAMLEPFVVVVLELEELTGIGTVGRNARPKGRVVPPSAEV